MKYFIIISLLFLSSIVNGQNKQCWLTAKTLQLPTFSQAKIDTLSIANVSLWLANKPINTVDKEIQKIIKRGSKFFLIKQTKTFVTLGFLEDEGEYVAVYAYSISKNDCSIISKELLAEETAWENAFSTIFIYLKSSNHFLERIKFPQ